jgi:hypothetical protein
MVVAEGDMRKTNTTRTTRRQPPKPFEATVDHDAEARSGRLRTVADCLRWPCVRDEMMAWATSLTTTNCGWSEYECAQEFIRDLRAAELRRLG